MRTRGEEVTRLQDAGVVSGINLLVRASELESAAQKTSRVATPHGIGNDRIIYLPMRGQDTPSPRDLARVAGNAHFQSMSCLLRCAPSDRFCSIGADGSIGHCSYTQERRALDAPTAAALAQARAGLALPGFVEMELPRWWHSNSSRSGGSVDVRQTVCLLQGRQRSGTGVASTAYPLGMRRVQLSHRRRSSART